MRFFPAFCPLEYAKIGRYDMGVTGHDTNTKGTTMTRSEINELQAEREELMGMQEQGDQWDQVEIAYRLREIDAQFRALEKKAG
jgi:hypothetical protein